MSAPIIDVSSHQGQIGWTQVAGSVQAAVIRLGFRGYHQGNLVYDSQYKINRKGCEANGVPFSLYFFPCSINKEEAEDEADFIIDACSGMKFVMPVFLDSEVAQAAGKGRADQLSKSVRTELLKTICDRLQSAGIPAGIYASTSWLNTRLDMSQLPYSVWVAQYAKALTYKGNFLMWQFTDNGTVPGINGRVDMSILHTVNQPANPYREPAATVRSGESGVIVKWIQFQLNLKGYKLTVDGSFGPKTLAAVRDYQQKRHITVDGIVGPVTRKALE